MFSVLVVSEGARPVGGEQVYRSQGDGIRFSRLGGIGQQVVEHLSLDGNLESRATILGHLQRGGSPTAFDRWLATRFGAAAVRLAVEGGFGRMVALQGTQVVDVSLAEWLATHKRVDLSGDAIFTARQLGICLGD
jgi:6-phosphofructokinase 1